jgi:hypothetical protein
VACFLAAGNAHLGGGSLNSRRRQWRLHPRGGTYSLAPICYFPLVCCYSWLRRCLHRRIGSYFVATSSYFLARAATPPNRCYLSRIYFLALGSYFLAPVATPRVCATSSTRSCLQGSQTQMRTSVECNQ